MNERPTGEGFSDEQRAGLEARQADRDRTLAAMHSLEQMLAAAAPGRNHPWRDAVLEALAQLQATARQELDNAERPDSLLSDVKRTQPLLASRVRAVRAQYRQILEAIDALRAEFGAHPEDAIDVGDARERLSWLLTAMRHQRARESDLIYEAYYDAFRTDLMRDRPSTEWH